MTNTTHSSKPFRPLDYWHPRFWPTWVGIGFIRLMSVLPWRAQQAVGNALGTVAYALVKKRTQVMQANLKLCFPELSDAARQHLIKQNFKSMGRAIAELGTFWYASDTSYLKRSTVHGWEYIEALHGQENILLLGVHFTPLEAAVRYINARGIRLKGMYKPAKEVLFDAYMTHRRNVIYHGAMIPNNQSQQFAQALANGQICWFAPDQSFHTHVVYAPLFGVECASLISTNQLAEATGAKVLPFFGVLNKDRSGYDIHVLPPLDNFPTGDAEADTAKVNAAMEAMIRYAPEQYLWGHRRFKDIKDQPNPYESDA